MEKWILSKGIEQLNISKEQLLNERQIFKINQEDIDNIEYLFDNELINNNILETLVNK